MTRLLVCPPDYFRIDYEINPWMRRSNAVVADNAARQWRGLMDVLERRLGVALERMKPVPGLPDLVFTANAAVVAGRRAALSRFRHPERQREEAHFEDWFLGHGYDVLTLDKECFFEGAGDLLGFADGWFGGYRQRSDIRAFPRLSEWFQREIIPLELIDSRFYHLDTCFCPLSGGDLLYFPAAFDEDDAIPGQQGTQHTGDHGEVCLTRAFGISAVCQCWMQLGRVHRRFQSAPARHALS